MELTNEEKRSIVMQHIKSVAFNIYNLQVSVISEQGIIPNNTENIDSLNSQISVENSKMQALEAELERLED